MCVFLQQYTLICNRSETSYLRRTRIKSALFIRPKKFLYTMLYKNIVYELVKNIYNCILIYRYLYCSKKEICVKIKLLSFGI